MTYPELQIQLDLNLDNQVDVLKNVDTCRWIGYGYLFVDNEDGQCYLFDIDGNLDDIGKVKYIAGWVFWNCTSLTTIKIPNSVKTIGYHAFICCTSLKEVIFKEKTMKQVKAMYGYPWGINNVSIIKVES